MYNLEPTKAFTKILKKLSQNEQKAVARKLVINPYRITPKYLNII